MRLGLPGRRDAWYGASLTPATAVPFRLALLPDCQTQASLNIHHKGGHEARTPQRIIHQKCREYKCRRAAPTRRDPNVTPSPSLSLHL